MASLKMAAADEAMVHLGSIESSWNWVISDVSGNIAYQMSGLMPKRHPEWNGFTPAPGWGKAYDWQGIISYKDLPNCINPEAGYIVTSNQDLNHLGKVDPINMPMGNYRAK
jgi:penicillin amidase